MIGVAADEPGKEHFILRLHRVRISREAHLLDLGNHCSSDLANWSMCLDRIQLKGRKELPTLKVRGHAKTRKIS